ncbi:MAG: hypothetical protein ACI9XC_002173 [Gammaproteobacteria bacterium]|jgi:hypothetical protein
MTTEQASVDTQTLPDTPQTNGWRTFGIIVITMVLTLAVGYWAISTWLFPNEFDSVKLTESQQQSLDEKLRLLGGNTPSNSTQSKQSDAYSEVGARRVVEFNEQELNALLARNTELANKLSIDLSENLISANLLIDIDPDFPILSGKTIKVAGGMELSLVDGNPSAILKGISIWGVPLPNAWVGNMKNIDLMKQFGKTGGFLQFINDGVKTIEVKDGKLFIELKE